MRNFRAQAGQLLSLEATLHQALGLHALTPEMRLLAIVEQRGTVAAREVRSLSGLSAREYSRSVHLLTERGLIRRLRNPADRRIHLLQRVAGTEGLRIVR